MLLMDGALGTFLLQHGFPPGSCLEEISEKRPSLLTEIHKSYLMAGSKAVLTNSFGANRIRLGRLFRSPKSRLERWNRLAVSLAREAVSGHAAVFASVGPLGLSARKMTPREMREIFLEQIRALDEEKPDCYWVETITALNEAEAAVNAVREVSDRPLIVTLAFPRGVSRLKTGTLGLMAKTLREAGADAIGINCGTHPEEAFDFLNRLRLVDPGPWAARPAAGIPGRPVLPEEFAKWGVRIAALGVKYLGGCCGTTPAHIRVLKERLDN